MGQADVRGWGESLFGRIRVKSEKGRGVKSEQVYDKTCNTFAIGHLGAFLRLRRADRNLSNVSFKRQSNLAINAHNMDGERGNYRPLP